MEYSGVATARCQDTNQELVHVKHGRMEISGLQSNQKVKRRRKLRKRRRSKLRRKTQILLHTGGGAE
jgi:hypothetical protein